MISRSVISVFLLYYATRQYNIIWERILALSVEYKENKQYHLGKSVAAILKMSNKKKVLKDPSYFKKYLQVPTTNTVLSGLEGSLYNAEVLTIQMGRLLIIHP